MTSPGTIPATREKGWVVVQVKPSKGVATEADKLIQERYKVGDSDPKDSFSPRGWSPTVSDFSLVTGAITLGTLGVDFYKGRSQVSALPLNTPPAITRELIVIPKTRLSPTTQAGLKNILTANNLYEKFKSGPNPLAKGNRLKTLGRFALIVNAGTFAVSLYKDLTHAEDLDRKFVVDFDEKAKTLNMTLIANNSRLISISGDYKALNFSFRINPSGEIELGQSASQSEASTEKEATNLAIINSENAYKSEGAVEALNDIVTLARQDKDEEALKALKSFLGQVKVDNYSDPDKQLIIDMRSKLGLEPASVANATSSRTTAGPSSTSTSNPTEVDLSFIDDLRAGPVRDALIQAREEGYLNQLENFKEKHKKVKHLKDMAQVINSNLTPEELKILDNITLP